MTASRRHPWRSAGSSSDSSGAYPIRIPRHSAMPSGSVTSTGRGRHLSSGSGATASTASTASRLEQPGAKPGGDARPLRAGRARDAKLGPDHP